MTSTDSYYRIFPLGDGAISFDLGHSFSVEMNCRVRQMQSWLRQKLGDSAKDIVCGYSTVTILYDPARIRKEYQPGGTAQDLMKDMLIAAWESTADIPAPEEKELVRIPVCYDREFASDIDAVAAARGMTPADISRCHQESTYYIYLIGFLPGFSYMGEVDSRLYMPRKINPVTVAPGSVGISGKQTGIYPLQCPGGWQIIGRTPIRLFDQHAEDPVKLKAGQYVQFYPISRDEFDYEWFRENGSAE